MALDGALVEARQAGPLTADRRTTLPHGDLEGRLGHTFAKPELLDLALSHVGAVKSRIESYQRLEFLGDRVLGVVVAEMLYETFPAADEGELSRRLAALVRRETCELVAQGWDVEPHIRLGAGERKALRRAILGDICEAIIGAVFLDGGLEAARHVVRRGFEAQMHTPARPLRDPKTALQEWAQARALPAPLYREVARTGPDHAPKFVVAVVVETHDQAEATGTSKRAAEQAAAAVFIAREGIGEPPTETA